MASSAQMKAPNIARAPPAIHTPKIKNGVCTCTATTCGFMKIPDPTMPPITIIVASNSPSCLLGESWFAESNAVAYHAAGSISLGPGNVGGPCRRCSYTPRRRYTECMPLGRLLITLGLLLVGAGVVVLVLGRLPIKLGRLPGDIYIQGKGSSFYFPLTTCLLISLVLSLLMWVLRK